jgi:hypothetical protein
MEIEPPIRAWEAQTEGVIKAPNLEAGIVPWGPPP